MQKRVLNGLACGVLGLVAMNSYATVRGAEDAGRLAADMAVIGTAKSLDEAVSTWKSVGGDPDARWLLVGESTSGGQLRLDLKTVSGPRNARVVWTMDQFPAGQYRAEPTAVESRDRTVFYCGAGEYHMTTFSLFDSEGSVLYTGGSSMRRGPVMPGSIMEAAYDFVCAGT